MYQTQHSSTSSSPSSTQLPRVTARLHTQAGSMPHSATNKVSATSSPSTLSNHHLLTDVELLKLCTQYGSQAKLWKQKFLGLLPEVERRRLYLQQGCSSVFEFAAKVGGVSKEQVLVVLRLHRRFESTPVLKRALVAGEVSVNKLARVVSVATPENQEFWVQKSQQLSQAGLETLVRDSKSLRAQTQNPNKTEKIAQYSDLGLSTQMHQKLLSLRNKGLDLNQLLEEFLDQHEEKIQQEKQKIVEELRAREDRKSRVNGAASQSKKQGGITPSRYIPAKVKSILKQEYGEKCAQEACSNRATNIHHTRRFGLNPSHNPLFLAPLCKAHHEIAHSLDIQATKRRRFIQRT